jgi:GNAT superfamily N-acetyltransferase
MPIIALIIRHVLEEDVRGVLQVHHQAVHDGAASFYDVETLDEWAPPVDAGRIEGFLEKLKMAGETMFVATQADKVVGFSSVVVSRDELRAVYVTPTAMRNGIGSRLLAAAEEYAKEHGLSKLNLNSSLNAQAFYSMHGYARVADGVHRLKSGRTMACVQMSKNL